MSIITDIRIDVAFRGHRKRRKLRALLGPGSTDYLIDLWIATAQNHPNGVLVGMSSLDVALEAGWEDDPEKFVSAMCDSGFLEKDESGVFRLHDWEEHQPWVVGAPDRTAKAKKAADAKWSKAKAKQPACPKHAHSNAPAFPYQPLNPPNPPSQGGESVVSDSSPGEQPEAGTTADDPGDFPSIEFEQFWEAYPRKEKKITAWKAWRALGASRPGLAKILDAVCRFAESDLWQKEHGRFVQQPHKWLEGKRWLDDPLAISAASPEGPPPVKSYSDEQLAAMGVAGRTW